MDGANCLIAAECSRRVEGLNPTDAYVLSLHNPNTGASLGDYEVSLMVTITDCSAAYLLEHPAVIAEAASHGSHSATPLAATLLAALCLLAL